jgi:ankyrin repeat protein
MFKKLFLLNIKKYIELLLTKKKLNMDIFDAIGSNDLVKVTKLLNSGIDVNVKNFGEWTPLHIACINDRVKVVKLLLNHPDIDINAKNRYEQTPLHIACRDGYVEVVKVLLNHPDIDVNAIDEDEWTPLHDACVRGRIEVVKLLLNHPKIVVEINHNEYKGEIRFLLKPYSKQMRLVNQILDTIEG